MIGGACENGDGLSYPGLMREEEQTKPLICVCACWSNGHEAISRVFCRSKLHHLAPGGRCGLQAARRHSPDFTGLDLSAPDAGRWRSEVPCHDSIKRRLLRRTYYILWGKDGRVIRSDVIWCDLICSGLPNVSDEVGYAM